MPPPDRAAAKRARATIMQDAEDGASGWSADENSYIEQRQPKKKLKPMPQPPLASNTTPVEIQVGTMFLEGSPTGINRPNKDLPVYASLTKTSKLILRMHTSDIKLNHFSRPPPNVKYKEIKWMPRFKKKNEAETKSYVRELLLEKEFDRLDDGFVSSTDDGPLFLNLMAPKIAQESVGGEELQDPLTEASEEGLDPTEPEDEIGLTISNSSKQRISMIKSLRDELRQCKKTIKEQENKIKSLQKGNEEQRRDAGGIGGSMQEDFQLDTHKKRKVTKEIIDRDS